MSLALAHQPVAEADYLAGETVGDVRHELVGGEAHVALTLDDVYEDSGLLPG